MCYENNRYSRVNANYFICTLERNFAMFLEQVTWFSCEMCKNLVHFCTLIARTAGIFNCLLLFRVIKVKHESNFDVVLYAS